ncbi:MULTISPECIES: hypothetical protein [Pseudomonas]|uniref:hypothetical protein n=1 Tax=Pseudomonas TaxID=286 RepID=UPI000710137D|nr:MULTISPECIES: hypothetical protein [Pseudomonas]KQW19903.1 hypothetical protein ASC85_08625 [Pseudomonas sp. Root401]WHS57488.1 hypothetical protein QLH64_31200 [Pseudomonas brassicacearum]
MSNYKRSFVQTSRAWYAASALHREAHERFIVRVEAGENYHGEFEITWPKISPAGSAELRVLDDGWRALSLCNDLVAVVAGIGPLKLTVEAFQEHLADLGFEDATETDRQST